MNITSLMTIGEIVDAFLRYVDRLKISVPEAPVTVVKSEIRQDRFYVLAVKGTPRVYSVEGKLAVDNSAGQFYYFCGDDAGRTNLDIVVDDIPVLYRPWFVSTLQSIAADAGRELYPSGDSRKR